MVMRSAVLRDGTTYTWEEPELDGMEQNPLKIRKGRRIGLDPVDPAHFVRSDEKDSGVQDRPAESFRSYPGNVANRLENGADPAHVAAAIRRFLD